MAELADNGSSRRAVTSTQASRAYISPHRSTGFHERWFTEFF